MALANISSPHLSKPGDTGNGMRQGMLATLPGVLALTFFVACVLSTMSWAMRANLRMSIWLRTIWSGIPAGFFTFLFC